MKDVEIPSAHEIVEEIKKEIAPDPITREEGTEIISDYHDCVNGYKRDVPKLAQNDFTKAVYVNTCLIRKGWSDEAIKQGLRNVIL